MGEADVALLATALPARYDSGNTRGEIIDFIQPIIV